jgi:hypothetical protein
VEAADFEGYRSPPETRSDLDHPTYTSEGIEGAFADLTGTVVSDSVK